VINRIRFILKGIYGGNPDIDVVLRDSDIVKRVANYHATVDGQEFTVRVEVSKNDTADKLYIYEGFNSEGGHWHALIPLLNL